MRTDFPTNCRHILSLSGGKDSTALAIYLKDRIPDLEYVFCDTGHELPETHEYLRKLQAVLPRPIVTLNPLHKLTFEDILAIKGGFLPSPQVRWCTEYLKIKPFERYIGDDPVILYVGIRADEPHRKGYISTKPNIRSCFPFVEDGITRADVFRILEESGLGLPDYYRWRSRSGCYFCFFQQRVEWVGLLENHPDLFERAKSFEKFDPATGKRYTWIQGESLEELSRPERIAEIKKGHQRKMEAQMCRPRACASLMEVFAAEELADTSEGCLICHL